MSGEVMTYVVIDPQHPWELRARLLSAAEKGELARFKARELHSDEVPDPVVHDFTVRVENAQFKAPASFDTYTEDETYIQIKLPEAGPVEFEVIW